MKESRKSLKYVFILFGFFEALGLVGVSIITLYPIQGIISLVTGFFGVAEIYIGIKLNELIPQKSKIIINFLWFYLAFVVFADLYYYFINKLSTGPTLFNIILTTVVTLYLISSIQKLSKEPSK